MLIITSLDHLGLKVTGMDRSPHFYYDVLGLEVVHRSGPHENGGRSATLRVGDQKIDVFYRPDSHPRIVTDPSMCSIRTASTWSCACR